MSPPTQRLILLFSTLYIVFMLMCKFIRICVNGFVLPISWLSFSVCLFLNRLKGCMNCVKKRKTRTWWPEFIRTLTSFFNDPLLHYRNLAPLMASSCWYFFLNLFMFFFAVFSFSLLELVLLVIKN